jgi:hypothetical protein
MDTPTGTDAQRIKYSPVIGGVTHLTWMPERPADGVVVRLLCGSAYEVGSRHSRHAVRGCDECVAAWKERIVDAAP